MAIELISRPLSGHLSGEPGASKVVTSHLALNEITEIRLLEAQFGVAGLRKIGPDLEISFTDGRNLHLGNFFVAGPDGEFSTVVSGDGAELVSGLLVPEPDPEALTFQSDAAVDSAGGSSAASQPLPRADAEAAPSLSFAAESGAAPEGGADTSPGGLPGGLGLAGGLASGLGGVSLLSSGEGSDSSPAAEAAPLNHQDEAFDGAFADAAFGDDAELSDAEIIALLGIDTVPEDTLDHARGALVSPGTESAAGGPLLLASTDDAPAALSPLAFDDLLPDIPIESDL